METVKVTLCPNCTECPVVEINDSGVTIGENENTVKLTHTEWNELAAHLRTGQLTDVHL